MFFMEKNLVLSLETHLFFARIMKEHGLFLEAGFPCADTTWIKKADWFRQEFEALLRDTVELSQCRVCADILRSEELVTEFTLPAERQTERLSGVAIDSSITRRQMNLRASCRRRDDKNVVRAILELNQRALKLLNDFIAFKESILTQVSAGRIFTFNYPLLIEHILREAKLYRATIQELMGNRELSHKELGKTEAFWNQIMMEHALFIRGLLDPTQERLIETADQYAQEYKRLLERANRQEDKALQLTNASLQETLRYRDFKAAGAQGILDHSIESIILPLLADHVLREANHYIRLLS